MKDGSFTKTTVGEDYISTQIACKVVEGGTLTVEMHSHPGGWLHLNFSGLGDRELRVGRYGSNTADIYVVKVNKS